MRVEFSQFHGFSTLREARKTQNAIPLIYRKSGKKVCYASSFSEILVVHRNILIVIGGTLDVCAGRRKFVFRKSIQIWNDTHFSTSTAYEFQEKNFFEKNYLGQPGVVSSLPLCQIPNFRTHGKLENKKLILNRLEFFFNFWFEILCAKTLSSNEESRKIWMSWHDRYVQNASSRSI